MYRPILILPLLHSTVHCGGR